MTRVRIALTLDFDAQSGLEDLGMKNRALISRGTYGPNIAIPRIIKLLQTLNLPLTCFIPGVTLERFPDSCKAMRDAGFELAFHGYDHTAPEKLTLEEERKSFEKGLALFDQVLGIKPLGYRAPWLALSDNTVTLLKEFGFKYDASELGADRPYEVEGLLEIPGKLQLIDTPLFMNFATDSLTPFPIDPDTVYKIWEAELLGMLESDEECLFVHTIHPLCIGHLGRLRTYKQFLQVAKDQDVTFVNMQDI